MIDHMNTKVFINLNTELTAFGERQFFVHENIRPSCGWLYLFLHTTSSNKDFSNLK